MQRAMLNIAYNRWIPPRDERCIWMAAGVLTYKLCDKNFDCESCRLHIALTDEPRKRKKDKYG